MIGLSLSFCVRDIAEGKVKIEDVSVIYAGTRAVTQDQWADVLDRYCHIYWNKLPNKCMAVAKQLMEDLKIRQPRADAMISLICGDEPAKRPWHKDGRCIQWAESEADLIWEEVNE